MESCSVSFMYKNLPKNHWKIIESLIQGGSVLKDKTTILVNLCCHFLTAITSDNFLSALEENQTRKNREKKQIKPTFSQIMLWPLKNLLFNIFVKHSASILQKQWHNRDFVGGKILCQPPSPRMQEEQKCTQIRLSLAWLSTNTYALLMWTVLA